MHPTIDVIIINWNTGRQLRECLIALSASCRDRYQFGNVVVVDNASTDGSASELVFPNLPLSVIRNFENRGFAAACNQGAAICEGDYLLFLNPDTRVLPKTLAESVRWMESPQNARVGILGVQLTDESGAVGRHCSRFLATRRFLYVMFGLNRLFPSRFPDHVYSEWDHMQSRPVEHVMGAYFFIRHAMFKEIGAFDERFFVYYEDVDLSLRALKAGWESFYLAGTQCYHAGGGSSRQVKARRLFYALRSRIYYAFKNFGVVNATALLLATLLVEPVSRLAQGVLRGSVSQLREVTEGYLLLWKDMPRILGSPFLRNKGVVRSGLGKRELA
jgi:N-acetylglucosaminyl-diphospho-decaprenol L-rhamnosyltransferase